MDIELQKCLNLAKGIAEGSADIALKYFGFNVQKTWKNDNTPLTEADTKINKFVIEEIGKVFPDHSVQGEEESSKKEGSKYIWVCDPIDGTMPYSLGLPIFTFSLALVDQSNGQPILGVINDPVHKNMYWAYKGAGAFRNGEKISVSKDNKLERTYFCLDGSQSNYSKMDSIAALREKGAKVMTLLSFIYGAVQVPNGKFAGAVFINRYAHDVAALKIINDEAGGKATDLEGNERRYDEDGNGCILSNGILHQDILDCIQRTKNI